MFYLALTVLKLLALPLSLLPRPVFLAVGRGLGWILRMAGFRAEIVRSNMALALPELSEGEREKLFRAHYAELGILFLEMLRMFYRFDRFYDSYVDVEGKEHVLAALAKGKGAFVFSAHVGNWEILCVAGYATFGNLAVMVTKELKPRWLHRAVAVTRELNHVKMAFEPKTMQGILRGLKANGLIGWMMDQFAGAPVGARVPFFGKPVGSHTAMAALALRTGAPVIPAVSVRKPDGRYVVRFEAPMTLLERETAEATLIANTAQFVRKTEEWVREFPAQWLWIHRRWKGDLSPLPPQVEGEMLK